MTADLNPVVRIREVSPRDGLQNEPEILRTEDKVRLIEGVFQSGVRRIEATSFVRPDWIPQLGDASEVLRRLRPPDDAEISVLVPNLRGLEMALPLRDKFDVAVGFFSVSEQHNRHNVNMSVAESLVELEKIFARARTEQIRAGAVMATSFGCPYEGAVPADRALELVRSLVEMGVEEVAFGDTTGMANPLQVREFFAAAAEAAPDTELTAHFHNTRGQGLANALAALEAGCRSFESSIGELGGCPVPPGATGNVASEDLIAMLHEMGFHTGIDLESLLQTARMMSDLLGRPLGSHLLQAGPIDWGGQGGASAGKLADPRVHEL